MARIKGHSVDPRPLPLSRKICNGTGRSSDLFLLRRLPSNEPVAKIVVAMRPVKKRGGTHSRGNCCRLSRHSLLIPSIRLYEREPIHHKCNYNFPDITVALSF